MAASPGESRGTDGRGRLQIAFFGHFGQVNLGNESTLHAILHHFRRLAPNADYKCICTNPAAVVEVHGIPAVPGRIPLATRWTPRNRLSALARRLVVGIPGELYQWLNSLRTLGGADALIVPGTGLLEDADTLLSWGPYDLFRWSVAAKLCRCRLLFVSVGAGPLDSRAGRSLVKAALSLADFRSYRDESTVHYLEGIGFRTRNDPIYPDLAFSLPESMLPTEPEDRGRGTVVGLGLMKASRGYSAERPTSPVYSTYLEAVADFAHWLLSHAYHVRLLFGDVADKPVMRDFRLLLESRSTAGDEGRLIEEPIDSVEELIRQIAETDLVVATRFHNALLALLLGKPVIAISYHHKCSSLMSQMDLSQFCLDVYRVNSIGLIDQFSQLVQDVDSVSPMIRKRVEICRELLDKQYSALLREICSG